jgi:hypothetical protein
LRLTQACNELEWLNTGNLCVGYKISAKGFVAKTTINITAAKSSEAMCTRIAKECEVPIDHFMACKHELQ